MSKNRSLKIVIVALLALATVVGVASAQNAKTAAWLVSTTYQNVGSATANITFSFYPENNATPINFTAATLPAGAGTSLYIGAVSGIVEGFRGNAVVSSDQPLVATVVQFSNATGIKSRLLSNGFQSSDAASQYLIATTLLNKFSRTTVFSIQNTESFDIKAVVRFYDADNAGALASTITHTIPANSSKYIDLSVPANTGLSASLTTFNGSAIVSGVAASDDTTPAKVVAAASEFYLNQPMGANFEGIPLSAAANTIYMATGLCQNSGLDSYYAVQNASLSASASIMVTYRSTDGTVKTTDGPYTIGAGGKKSITTCSPSTGVSMAGFTGSAVIVSTGAPIAVIGKAQYSPVSAQADKLYVFTAFMGQSAGTSKMALPFVRWANDADFNAASNVGGKQRTYIAIQNLESTSIKVTVTFKDKNGVTVTPNAGGANPQTITIPAFAKANTNANTALVLGTTGQFGYYTDGTFGGGAVIEAHTDNPTAKFIAIVRAQNPGAGEDYNSMPID
jgi:hypothetical protein